MKKLILTLLLSIFFFPLTSPIQAAGNHFGDGGDGDVTISTNTNIGCTQDSDMALKQYNSLTINSGVTLTTDNRCKGLFIYVKGNATINGSLSMTARGAYVDTTGVSASGLRLPMLKSGSTDTLAAADFAGAGSSVISAVANQPAISGDGKIYVLEKAGNAGAPGPDAGSGWDGYPGGTGGNKTGGGGGGGGGATTKSYGAAGTAFSGGSAGACQYTHYMVYDHSIPTANGGPGGDGIVYDEYAGGAYACGGGAGNNGGSNWDGSGSGWANPGGNGTGGVLYLIVGGNLTIGDSGVIQADGVAGGTNNYYGAAGGSSGGGAATVLYGGDLSNSGAVRANGGPAPYGGSHGSPGGAGGNGLVVLEQVDASFTPPCQPGIADTSHIITENCSFSKTVDGLDAGSGSTNTSTITINGGDLTINSGYKVAAGSFVLTSGSIYINTGGQFMAGYPIWLVDYDEDGYPDTTTHYAQFAAPSNGRRQNLLTSLTTADCDDANGAMNLSCSGGTGDDNAVTISANTDINTTDRITSRSCPDGGDGVNYSASALTSTTATVTDSTLSGCIAADDEILLINLQGTTSNYTNVGNYEFLTVDSVAGGVITFTTSKTKFYGNGASDDTNIGTATSNQRVMVQRVPQYSDLTVNSSINFYPSAWNGTKGGVMAFRASGTVTVTGTIHANSRGYRGFGAQSGGESFCKAVAGASGTAGTAYCGGGAGGSLYNGAGSSGTATGGAGGGGAYAFDSGYDGWAGGGGGGGYGSGAGGGQAYWYGGSGGTNTSGNGSNGYGPDLPKDVHNDRHSGAGGGGGTYGDANLVDLMLGSGAGGGGGSYLGTGGAGGAGGGIVIIGADIITVTGNVSSNGGGGGNSSGGYQYPAGYYWAYPGSGGGGAGGSVKISVNTANLDSQKVTATGGGGATRNYNGGGGGEGRIVVDSDSITGTTNPSYVNP